MNLVVNGDFQTGTLSGWIVSFGTGTVSTNGFPSGPTPYYGLNYTSSGRIRQVIAVVPGTTYYFSFQNKQLTSAGQVTFNVRGTTTNNFYLASVYPSPPTWRLDSFTFPVLPADNFVLLQIEGIQMIYDNIWMSTSPFCYTGDTLIRTLSLKTNQREETRADAIISTSHRVINTEDQEIEVIKNIVSGPVTRLVTFRKGEFGPDLPHKDLRLTRGHKLVVDGEEVRAGDLSVEKDGVPPRGEYGKCKPELVYSLVLPSHQHIYANGQPVVAFGLDEWNAVSNRVSHTTTDETISHEHPDTSM